MVLEDLDHLQYLKSEGFGIDRSPGSRFLGLFIDTADKEVLERAARLPVANGLVARLLNTIVAAVPRGL